MPYYHNTTERIVYNVPDEPVVNEKKTKPTKRNKRSRREGWFVQTEIEITRADNFIKPGTNQWHYKTSDPVYEYYQPTDLKEQVISLFKMYCLKEMGNKITKDEYDKLKKLYEEEASKNRPPL